MQENKVWYFSGTHCATICLQMALSPSSNVSAFAVYMTCCLCGSDFDFSIVQVLTRGISLCDISTKLGGLWVMSGTSSNMWHITVWYFNQAWRSVGHVWYKFSTHGISLCDISTKLGGLWVMPGTSSQHVAYHCVIFQPSLEVCGSCLVQVLNTWHITV